MPDIHVDGKARAAKFAIGFVVLQTFGFALLVLIVPGGPQWLYSANASATGQVLLGSLELVFAVYSALDFVRRFHHASWRSLGLEWTPSLLTLAQLFGLGCLVGFLGLAVAGFPGALGPP